MEKTLKQILSDEKYKNEVLEYSQNIRKRVKDRSYFKEGIDWYFFQYVNQVSEVSTLIICTVICFVLIFFVKNVSDSMYPLVEKVPIILEKSYDEEERRQILPLKQGTKYDAETRNIDEAVLKYLIKLYVSNKEGFDFRDGDVEKYKDKMNYVKENSSYSEYEKFKAFMSEENDKGPRKFFGKNTFKTVSILDFKFIRKQEDNMLDMFNGHVSSAVPDSAEVTFLTNQKSVDEDQNVSIEQIKFLAKIKFSFNGVDKDNKNANLEFVVTEYKLFKI